MTQEFKILFFNALRNVKLHFRKTLDSQQRERLLHNLGSSVAQKNAADIDARHSLAVLLNLLNAVTLVVKLREDSRQIIQVRA